MQSPKLYALYKIVQPAEYNIEASVCAIGRSSMCEVIVQLKSISRLHARIERDGPVYVLYDTNSVNGTFVNGCRIHGSHVLKNQDLIGLSADTALLRFENPNSMAQLVTLR